MTETTSRLASALGDRYTIERKLGEGGMATVYLAHDVKHDRKVAIKVLRPELAAVLGAERFVQEIKTTANLQHPHILPLHDSGDVDGFLYYVMPYVEGETLRDKLDREKQLGIDEAVKITTEVADALDYAHRHNVIHRDIKPENILLHDGRPMVADFGIALAVSAAGGTRLTETGLSMGTPQYMSPEQAMGDRTLDGRSDLYSLGCVTYEMLTGEPPFTGPTAQSIFAKIMNDRPRPLREIRDTVPPRVEAGVQTALQKLPADRFKQVSMFASVLDGTTAMPHPIISTDRMRAAGFRSLVVGGVAIAVVGFLGGRWIGGAPSDPAPIGRSRQITFTGSDRTPALSPDGGRLARHVIRCGGDACQATLVVQELAGGDPVVIEQLMASADDATTYNFIWSLDWDQAGERLIYALSGDSAATGVYSVPWLGGTPTKLTGEFATAAVYRAGGAKVDWLAFPKGFEGTPSWRTLDLSSGDDTTRQLPVFATHMQWHPNGEWLALMGQDYTGQSSERPLLSVFSANGELRDTLRGPFGDESNAQVRWTPRGDGLVFLSGGSLWRVAVDTRTGTLSSEALLLVDGLQNSRWPAHGLDLAPDGSRLVYERWRLSATLHAQERDGDAWITRTLTEGTAWVDFPAISPDGATVAYVREDYLGSNIYVRSFAGGISKPLTATSAQKEHLQWSPSGRHVGYLTEEEDADWLTTVSVDGGIPRRVGTVAGFSAFPRWAWFSQRDSLVFLGTDGRVLVSGLDAEPRELAKWPDTLGVFWGFAVSPNDDSLAVFTNQFKKDVKGWDPRLLVHVAPLRGGDTTWKPRFSGAWESLHRRPVRGNAMEDWSHLSAHHWRGDGDLLFTHSRHRGRDVYADIWAIPASGGQPREVLNLATTCGAPTFVSVTSDGSRLVCVRRELSTDIWMLENPRLDP